MIDLTFEVEGIKYKLTSDTRQYILQRRSIVKDKDAKTFGQEVLSSPKFYRTIPEVFACVTRTHPIDCDKVISSLIELQSHQRAVRRSVVDVIASIEEGTQQEEEK